MSVLDIILDFFSQISGLSQVISLVISLLSFFGIVI